MNSFKEITGSILEKKSESCGCYLWLVEVIGKRFSFVCGRNPDYPLLQEITEISVSSRYRLLAQKESGEFRAEDLSVLKETGEIIGKHIP